MHPEDKAPPLDDPLETTPETLEAPKKKPKPLWRANTEAMLVALGLAVFARVALAEPRYIPSESMLPSLQVEDRVLVEKVSGYFRAPARGDILVFQDPNPDQEPPTGFLEKSLLKLGYSSQKAYIKRVIGLPGDTLEVKDHAVYINGEALAESQYTQEPPAYSMPLRTIPQGHLFMMGDNRNNSFDSHIWGALPEERVIGRAIVVFWPLSRAHFLGVKQP